MPRSSNVLNHCHAAIAAAHLGPRVGALGTFEIIAPARRLREPVQGNEVPCRDSLGKRKINLSQSFAGQNVGIKEVSDRIWQVSFMHYDLGFFDHEACRLERLKTRSSQKCYLCLRYKPLPM